MTPGERTELLKKHYAQRVASSPAGTVSGVVLSADDEPLGGVSVQVDTLTTVTDPSGHYSLAGVPVGSHLVNFTHPQYVFTQKPVFVMPAQEPRVDANLLARSAQQHLDADKGGTISQGRLTLTFSPNVMAFSDGTPVHGQIDVSVTVFDARQPRHIIASPARLEGIDINGNQVGLISYGMAEIEAFQGTQRLQISPGQIVMASMDVTGVGPSVDSIPMWHHDTTLGLWVQEGAGAGTTSGGNAVGRVGAGGSALIEEHADGTRVATAALPHFSSWNWDLSNGVINGSSCTVVRVPYSYSASGPVTNFRAIGTDASGNIDTSSFAWTINSQCDMPRLNSTACATDSPSGSWGSSVWFKYQAQINGTWCDLSVQVETSPSVSKTVLQGADINNWLTEYGVAGATGTWCGIPAPASTGFILGPKSVSGFPNPLPAARVQLLVTGSSCNSLIGPQAATVSGDSGFQTMAANAASGSQDIDRDGIKDSQDNCFGNSSGQVDSDGNGIGDACESYCNIPLNDPNSTFYDFDQDTIDDLCDNRYTTFNPSQYVPTF